MIGERDLISVFVKKREREEREERESKLKKIFLRVYSNKLLPTTTKFLLPSPRTMKCRVCEEYTILMCSRCMTVAYCSKEHQIKDWKDGHHEECFHIQTVNSCKKETTNNINNNSGPCEVCKKHSNLSCKKCKRVYYLLFKGTSNRRLEFKA